MTDDPETRAMLAATDGRWARWCVLGRKRDDGSYMLAGSFPELDFAISQAKHLARVRGRVCGAFIVFDPVERHVCGVVSAVAPEETD